MANLCRLVYVSQQTRLLADADVASLVEASGRRNAADGITGLLLHGGGQFIQVLEGPLEVVADRFDVIRQDARHHKVQRMLFEFAPDRMFPSWWMGRVNVDLAPPVDQARLATLVRVARSSPSGGSTRAAAVTELLREFKMQVIRTASAAPDRAAG